jgi:hypothetical protein
MPPARVSTGSSRVNVSIMQNTVLDVKTLRDDEANDGASMLEVDPVGLKVDSSFLRRRVSA